MENVTLTTKGLLPQITVYVCWETFQQIPVEVEYTRRLENFVKHYVYTNILFTVKWINQRGSCYGGYNEIKSIQLTRGIYQYIITIFTSKCVIHNHNCETLNDILMHVYNHEKHQQTIQCTESVKSLELLGIYAYARFCRVNKFRPTTAQLPKCLVDSVTLINDTVKGVRIRQINMRRKKPKRILPKTTTYQIPNYSKYTVKELRAVATKYGLTRCSRLCKQDLVRKVTDHAKL